jgi:hypothetical protein
VCCLLYFVVLLICMTQGLLELCRLLNFVLYMMYYSVMISIQNSNVKRGGLDCYMIVCLSEGFIKHVVYSKNLNHTIHTTRKQLTENLNFMSVELPVLPVL